MFLPPKEASKSPSPSIMAWIFKLSQFCWCKVMYILGYNNKNWHFFQKNTSHWILIEVEHVFQPISAAPTQTSSNNNRWAELQQRFWRGLCKESILSWKPVSIVQYTIPLNPLSSFPPQINWLHYAMKMRGLPPWK